MVKNPPANARYSGLIPRSGRSPGKGNGNPLRYSCLGNSMDRGVWWATVHGVSKSRTGLSEHRMQEQEAGRGSGVGRDLSQEGPTGSCSLTAGQPPIAPLFGLDEGRVPRARAAISFCQLSLGIHHS